MRVSVVTPCLNPGLRLERCLRSVAEQSYPQLEHLVVDGGSTDGTVELLERSGVRFISEPDAGQTDAIAKGMGLAGGDLLTWLNADDTLTQGAVQHAVAAGADWVYGDCEVLEGSARRIWRPPRHFGARELEAGEVIPQPGTFFSRSIFERAGGLDSSFDLAMDIDLWVRFVDLGVVPLYVPAVLSVFEVHDVSKTGSVNRGEFMVEHARALAKSGRTRAASAALGRAAAVSGGDVDLEADRLARGAQPWVDEPLLRAAAAAELAVIGARRRRPSSLARLLSPRIWRYPETRRRMLAGARRELSQR